MSRIDFVTGAPVRYMPLVDRLATVPDRVEAVLSGAGREEIRRTPPDGGWPAAHVLAHMVSYARHSHAFLVRMVWMTEPVRQSWDEELEVRQEGWLDLGPAELLERLRRELSPTIELLSETPDAAWGRPGTVLGQGRRSLRQQVQRHIDHMEEHVGQLERTLRASAPAAAR
jgi:hypothetical protein